MFTVNKYGNCGTDLIGSGTRSCDIKSFGDIAGIGLHAKGTTFALDTSTATALWTTSLKELKTFPYLGIYNFEQTTPENEKATSSTGVMSEIREGKPQFNFTYDSGGCFHKSLFDKRGKGRWDISLIFQSGVLFAQVSDTEIAGFDMGMFSVETFKLLQGTDPQTSTAMIQLLDALEFNANHVFFTWEALGVNLSKVNGVVETTITYVGDVVADDELTVKVSSACNVDDVILDLDDEALWDLGGNETVTISSVAYNVATEDYTFTLSGALTEGLTVAPYLTDGTYNVVEDTTGNLFKGQAATATVAAAPSA